MSVPDGKDKVKPEVEKLAWARQELRDHGGGEADCAWRKPLSAKQEARAEGSIHSVS